jgi:hypothetical protein
MKGRAWTHGPVRLDLTLFAPALAPSMTVIDYMAGVFDTLDGSSGRHFTYLPVVYEDDCQCVMGHTTYRVSPRERYRLVVTFLKSREAA